MQREPDSSQQRAWLSFAREALEVMATALKARDVDLKTVNDSKREADEWIVSKANERAKEKARKGK
jgi:hypothetical protein